MGLRDDCRMCLETDLWFGYAGGVLRRGMLFRQRWLFSALFLSSVSSLCTLPIAELCDFSVPTPPARATGTSFSINKSITGEAEIHLLRTGVEQFR